MPEYHSDPKTMTNTTMTPTTTNREQEVFFPIGADAEHGTCPPPSGIIPKIQSRVLFVLELINVVNNAEEFILRDSLKEYDYIWYSNLQLT